ncbi:MAG: hypothetical protein AAB539_02740 [Patescibacteria group bacterium]
MQQRKYGNPQSGGAGVWLVIFGLLALLIGIVIVAGRSKKIANLQRRGAETDNILPEEPERKLADTDTDGDGLKDWEEVLYGTKTDNPDSDSDGATDNEEVRNSHDPLKPGPNDKLVIKDITAALPAAKEKKNLTDELSALFVQKYFADKVLSDAPFDQQQLVNDLLQQIYSGPIASPVVDPKTFAISEDNSPAAIKKYLNSYIGALERNLVLIATGQNPLLIITNIHQLDDVEKELVKLDPFIAQYQAAYGELIKLPVTSSWTKYHERALNLLLTHTALLQEARSASDDILKIAPLLSQFSATIPELTALINDLKAAVRASNITFGENDPAGKLLQL